MNIDRGLAECCKLPKVIEGLQPGSERNRVFTSSVIMAASTHPAAAHHLPLFITDPGQTDILMLVTGVVLLLSVLLLGIVFFRLHTLPERIAHRSHKLQFEIVAVLGLLALFTHIHAFWVAGLLLALIDFPDLGGWLGRDFSRKHSWDTARRNRSVGAN